MCAHGHLRLLTTDQGVRQGWTPPGCFCTPSCYRGGRAAVGPGLMYDKPRTYNSREVMDAYRTYRGINEGPRRLDNAIMKLQGCSMGGLGRTNDLGRI